MCAAAGLLSTRPGDARAELAAALESGLATAARRAGHWQRKRTTLVHRRLAIQDLHRRPPADWASACGRYVLVFNGEIYNQARAAGDL